MGVRKKNRTKRTFVTELLRVSAGADYGELGGGEEDLGGCVAGGHFEVWC